MYCFSNAARPMLNINFIRSIVTKTCLLKSNDWSQKVLQEIKKYYALDKSILCFNRPGNYSLPKAVLNSNVRHVIFWEPTQKTKSAAQKLATEFPEKLSCVAPNYDSKSAKIVENYNLSDIEKFLLIHGHISFNLAAFYLLNQFANNSDMWKIAPMDMLILTTKNVYQGITSNPTTQGIYTLGSHLCHLFLNYELLLEVPGNAFTSNRGKGHDSFSMLRLTLKDDLLNSSMEERQTKVLIMKFLQKFNKIRTHRAIPILDQYFEGIGLDLIEEGIGMMDEIKNIPSSKWPKIVQIITSNPNYIYSAVFEENQCHE